ncbi:MAG: DNA polymerase III subunit gamma/tau [Bryobacteraceae bacterium]
MAAPAPVPYQVIARKYRPQTFSELVGQEHVRTTLGNAISQRRIAHGYILSGQRGTGKTTVARILARCLNCEKGPTPEPCMVCSACTEIAAGNAVDVIEIDAASNRGINEMRELRENVRYRPARGKFKVFIIDEAHQITTEAFNALLKTLEEPPEWVVFVLCTTEAHKIPTTIASRCQQFSFRSVDFTELVERMQWICEQEGIKASPEALGVVAQVGEGSVRDSLSALDQAIACCGDTLEEAEVRELLGLFSLDSLGEVSTALAAGDSRRMLEIVYELERNGRNLQHFCRELARYFRNLLVSRVAGDRSPLIAASQAEQEKLAAIAANFSEEDLTRYLQMTLDLYRELQYSLQPRLNLEIGLLRLIHAGRIIKIEEALAGLSGGGSPPAPPSPPKRNPPTVGGGSGYRASGAPPARPAPASMAQPAAAPQRTPPPVTSSREASTQAPAVEPGSLKERLLNHLRDTGQTLLADAVEFATVTEAPGEIRFAAPREFKLSFRDAGMRNAVQSVTGKPLRIQFLEADSSDSGPLPPAKAAPAQVDEQAAERALSNPEVQQFQERFPGSQVRAVRNLKDLN